jgi:hypothetical protein
MRCGKDLMTVRLLDVLVDCAYAMNICSAHLAVSWAAPRISPVVVLAVAKCC